MNKPTQLRVWRLARGLSQRDLASRLGLTHPFIGAVERGIRSMPADRVRDWAAALCVEEDEVWEWRAAQRTRKLTQKVIEEMGDRFAVVEKEPGQILVPLPREVAEMAAQRKPGDERWTVTQHAVADACRKVLARGES